MYNTIATADSYIAAHYTSASDERQRWEALSDDDKTVYLTNAFEAIEALPFRGRKADPAQETAFPRLPYQYGHTEEGAPQNVLAAEAELALWLSDEKKQNTSKKRKELQEDGVKSYSIGYCEIIKVEQGDVPNKIRFYIRSYYNGDVSTIKTGGLFARSLPLNTDLTVDNAEGDFYSTSSFNFITNVNDSRGDGLGVSVKPYIEISGERHYGVQQRYFYSILV